MSGTSPTSRTLKALREQGYRVGVVERFVGPLNIRVDLFHILDLIAIRPCQIVSMDSGTIIPGEILGVQSCGQAFSEHDRKITQEHPDAARDWILAGGMLELWGWRKLKVKRGGKAMVWTPRVKKYTLADFDQSVDLQGGKEADPPGSA